MARYIDVEDFSQMVYENFGRDGEYDYRDLIRILREQPTADVKEVVRGEWKDKPNVYGASYCSNCDYELTKNDTNYCPECGAEMRIRW